ncbi:MAG: bifunctional hydroxymethylpyrimidine kinase/phosphomethylpyrimidine kinase [bacterium]|nr:bifunctional hydroxymethylpyrimidine kinase/phosphomethylpyrimidine kinase [bacterium]
MGSVHSGGAGAGPPVAMTIAGSDPSGGAGIQADLKTFHAFDVYGGAVLTSLTVQNTTGVRGRRDVDAGFVVAQLAAVQDDLVIAAAKTGMLPTPEVIAALAAHLRARPLPALVVDPVLVATSGDALATPATAAALRALLPLATLVTPNLPEAAALTGRRVDDLPAMRDAGRALRDLGAAAVLVKGGHLPGRAVDVLATATGVVELDAPRVGAALTHGTGCSLSAAIAAGLAQGRTLEDAAVRAKRWLGRALAAAPAVGHGARPIDHRLRPDDDPSGAG